MYAAFAKSKYKNSSRPLTPAEEEALVQKMRKGNKMARKQLITQYLRTVVLKAKHYTSKGYSLIDLIEIGNKALLDALDTYKQTNRSRLSIHVHREITQAMENVNK